MHYNYYGYKMSNPEEQIVLRLPQGTSHRAEKLSIPISENSKYQAVGKIKKSMVMRIALLEGLKVLEQKYKAK